MLNRSIVVLVVLVVAFAILGAQGQPEIKKVAPSQTSPASGQQMFETHCAACHGRDGKGTGPAAKALKKPPADLTILAQRNGGKFPELRVFQAIHGELDVSAHGSKEMPVWGDVFKSMSKDPAALQMRLSNLTAYVRSIQVK